LGEGKRDDIRPPIKVLFRRSDPIIVTNGYYAREIASPFQRCFHYGSNPRILEKIKLRKIHGMVTGRCLCSYDPDEPGEELYGGHKYVR
jgi:hypothetical protein